MEGQGKQERKQNENKSSPPSSIDPASSRCCCYLLLLFPPPLLSGIMEKYDKERKIGEGTYAVVYLVKRKSVLLFLSFFFPILYIGKLAAITSEGFFFSQFFPGIRRHFLGNWIEEKWNMEYGTLPWKISSSING